MYIEIDLDHSGIMAIGYVVITLIVAKMAVALFKNAGKKGKK